MVYLMLGLAPVCIIYMIVSSSKRYSVTESAKMAGGVVFKHRDPGLLSKVWYSLVWILITSANLLLNMKRLKYGSGYGSIDPRKQFIFYLIALVIYVMIFIFSIQQYLKYSEFRLCASCFYLGGVKYDRKKYSYTLEGDTVIFSAKGAKNIEIDIPEKKKKEVLGILGKHYTKSENGQIV